jgi:hypothetical protein
MREAAGLLDREAIEEPRLTAVALARRPRPTLLWLAA